MIQKINFLMFGFICFMLFSCCNNKKEYLTRDWVVNSLELDGINYGRSIMSFNMLKLKNDNTGSIPYIDRNSRDMKWNLVSPNDDGYYIEIYDSVIDYFNDTFEVVTIDKDNYSVQFVGKRVKLYCQGVGPMCIGI